MTNKNRLFIIKGKDIIKMTQDILEAMNPEIGTDKSILIGIKPNLVCVSNASEGATTHPEIVEGIIQYLNGKGYKNIMIIESSWVGANTEDAALKMQPTFAGIQIYAENITFLLLILKTRKL